MRSFLGPVNVCARFNLDLATVSEQRRTISVGHSTIKRKGQQIEKDAETRFITNASPIVRLGAVLKHVQKWLVMLAEGLNNMWKAAIHRLKEKLWVLYGHV